MIVDQLENSSTYTSLHPRLAEAFAFLRDIKDKNLSLGRNDISGDGLFAIVVKDKGRGKSESKLETHNKFIDIQFTVSGEDCIGWERRSACGGCSEGYDAENDLEFYSNPAETWVTVKEGCFALFFPDDAHAPMGTDGDVDKVVVKVACE